MEAAIAKARSSVDEFIEQLQKGEADTYSVKAPIHDGGETEHFWIMDASFKDGSFTGVIGNEPGLVKNVKLGDTWTIKKEEISDWMYTIGRKIHGGYTIDPLLESFPKEQADEMRKNLVR